MRVIDRPDMQELTPIGEVERLQKRVAELERMADADGQVIAGMRSESATLRDALVDLLDEYEDRKIQFGGDVLCAKHEDANTLPKVCQVLRDTAAKSEAQHND